MRAVVQRVRRGAVSVDQQVISQIEKGYVILLGIGPEDDEAIAGALAHKIALLRVFEDGDGKMNRSILDVNGAALVVSQFTLYADTRKGNRPSFVFAAPPDLARKLVDRFCGFWKLKVYLPKPASLARTCWWKLKMMGRSRSDSR